MKSLIFISFLMLGGTLLGQSDSIIGAQDTSAIYVINSTNRLIQVGESFSVEFRDLKSLKEGHAITLGTAADVEQFFATCFKVLDQDITIVGGNYTVNRNVVSKQVVRIENKNESYFILTYGTLEKMEKAFARYSKEKGIK